MSSRDITWACHVCGAVRPDSRISVLSTERRLYGHRAVFVQNVRFCNDRPACVDGAHDVVLIPNSEPVE